jgi:lipoprotein-anchoring transpeptidase ErfK/SrfK
MWKWGSTTGLRTLSVFYLLGASAFGFALALQAQQPWALGARRAAEATGPLAVSTARIVREEAIEPAMVWAGRTRTQVSAWLWPKQEPVKVAAAKPSQPYVLRPSLPPPVAPPVKPQVKPAAPVAPAMELAQTETETAPLIPAPDASPPGPGEVARVLAHLKVSLTKELYDNFSLFLFVSKADHGPWSQRMFVFAKQDNGDLQLKYSFPVSTGREILMQGPSGQMFHTSTPTGYFQLDPDRIYRRYRSTQWGHPMPYAMFFSWEHDGLETGVAIHSAVDSDIALLGKRASAGCVRLNPQNAELLFNLIRKSYRGQTPLFAYDRRTATMAKDGLLMHDKAGNLQYTEGYRVLVLIENNGGDDVVAALF